MPSTRKINIALIILLTLSALTRALIAGSIELGNDEVYYYIYALFPDLSHFDHPPMVGLVIQAFTFNLLFDSEIFLRLASVVMGTASTWLMFLIGKTIKDNITGLYAALLFTSSFYGFVLTGTFILPDTPQTFFWLLSLYLLIRALPDRTFNKESKTLLLFAGLTTGLAFLSKYHAVFLVSGAFLYILFYNRRWLLKKETYGALFFFILLMMPVVLWNIDNKFISFTYHEERVSITESGIQPQYFITELAGEFFYNNPVNVVLLLLAIIALFRKKQFIGADSLRIILLISLPLLLVFLGFSLFRRTLPHWTGPAYTGMILITAAWLSETRQRRGNLRLLPWPLAAAIIFLFLVLTLAVMQIRTGLIPLTRMGQKDVTHDLVCWEQLGEKITPVIQMAEKFEMMPEGAPILTFRWFPAANFDYYIGRRTGNPVYALGYLERIHKYHWINKIRGNLKENSDAWYIALSDDYEDPEVLYGDLFTLIIPSDTIVLTRKDEVVRKAFVYRMIGLKEEMRFE